MIFLFLGCKKHKARAERRKVQGLVEVSISNTSTKPMTNVRMYLYNQHDTTKSLTNEVFAGDVAENGKINFIYNCREKFNFDEGGICMKFQSDTTDKICFSSVIVDGEMFIKGMDVFFTEKIRVEWWTNPDVKYYFFPTDSYSLIWK